MNGLFWLPQAADWTSRAKAAAAGGLAPWKQLVALAQYNLDFLKTDRLDQIFRKSFPCPPEGLETRPIRLALLGSSTTSHLLPAIRVGALRRNIWLEIYENDYGQIHQELMNPDSRLRAFKPDAVLFAFDSRSMTAGLPADAEAPVADAALAHAIGDLAALWRVAREELGCLVLSQTFLPIHPSLMGGNEHKLPASKARFLARLNMAIREAADEAEVALVPLDEVANRDGLASLYNPVSWHQAKQEVSLPAAPLYGDLVGRLLAASQGLSKKCLVLDLDNTIWGGVIGDDGLAGLKLGQGSALGEAFLDVQTYAKALSRRGVILAICSKNDEANAFEVFDKHPEMLLRRDDISCFIANWDDKATNLRRIAQHLSIGIDSLVFLDDNPFERDLVREALPAVSVPEVPDDCALVAQCLAAAGYFEALSITGEDRERTGLYGANKAREALRTDATDLPAYLAGLDMRLEVSAFDEIGLARTVQLINKTNQFNLTTRRYSEAEIRSVMADSDAFGLQLRLKDRFGDNGIIAIVIGRVAGGTAEIDTWLMSCRVLGRRVEEAILVCVVAAAERLGATRLIGHYRPTAKNGLVADLFPKLGFTCLQDAPEGADYTLDIADYRPAEVPIRIDVGG